VLKLHCKIHGLSRPLLQDETASSINRACGVKGVAMRAY
jgi:hypothetical protein